MPPILLTMALIVGAPALKEARPRPFPLLGEFAASAIIECGERELAPPGTTLTFTADGQCLMKEGSDKPDVTKFTVNEKREPAEIDITMPVNWLKRHVIRGIYRLDGDVLTICLSHSGERPKEFASPAGTSTVLMTLSRINKD